jgi:hypothetical protein
MGSSIIFLETPHEANKRCHMIEETSLGFQAIPRLIASVVMVCGAAWTVISVGKGEDSGHGNAGHSFVPSDQAMDKL